MKTHTHTELPGFLEVMSPNTGEKIILYVSQWKPVSQKSSPEISTQGIKARF